MLISADKEMQLVRATNVKFHDNFMSVALSDNREITIRIDNINWLKWLAAATPSQREKWILEPGGYAIYWDELDDGVEVCHLLSLDSLS